MILTGNENTQITFLCKVCTKWRILICMRTTLILDPELVARAQALIDALPADCGTPPRRIVMLPNPDLDVRFAASAWGFTLKADCFDSTAFASFVADHYGHGPEAVCSDNIDPLTAGAGGTPLCP